MEEKSTQVQNEREVLETLMNNKGASLQTLEFLKMVARSCYAENSLSEMFNLGYMN